MNFSDTLRQEFPGAVLEAQFVRESRERLLPYGFEPGNTLGCLAVCRDELCRRIGTEVSNAWGEVFHLGSLAGMIYLGKSGMRAVLAHAPTGEARERHAYYTLAHIGIDGDGRLGSCVRPGRAELSTACGALFAVRAELESGDRSAILREDDIEQCLLKRQLIPLIGIGPVPELVVLTRLVREIALGSLESLLASTIDAERMDAAVFSGILIHGPGANYVQPVDCYAILAGKRIEL